ncbi:MAG: hypothetical protein AAGG75_22145 [Bacteroidota bacterium]
MLPHSTFMSSNRTSKLIGLFLLGLILLNFPIINLFSKEDFLFGIPSLYIYLFLVWLLLIIFIAMIVRRKDNKKQP